MATITETPTNEQILSLFGWRGHYDVDSQWWERPIEARQPHPGLTIVPADDPSVQRIYAVPDYKNDPATLGEAERYCREQGWDYVNLSLRSDGWHAGIGRMVPPVVLFVDGVRGDTLNEAWWTAIVRAKDAQDRWRASQAEGRGV